MEEFSDKSVKAIWFLIKNLKGIIESLKQVLPIEKLDWSFSQSEEDGAFTVNVWGTGISGMNSFLIYCRPLDSSPQPKELYPSGCVATGTIRIGLSEELEICASGDDWMIHCQDKWTSFSAPVIAFLIGKAQHAPAIPKGE